MSVIIEKLKKNKMTLIVSLPGNSAAMARAAEEAGADALKVHINLEHQASGVKFGSFDEEKENLEKIVKKVKIPVGIVPGSQKLATEDEMAQLARLGISFFDVEHEYLPSWMLEIEGMARIAAINERYTLDKLLAFESRGIEILEAAVVPHARYGERMTIGDLKHYIAISSIVDIPVVVPTQKAIMVEEVPTLFDTGVKGLMIGAIVTGKDKSSLSKSTRAFRQAIDKLE